MTGLPHNELIIRSLASRAGVLPEGAVVLPDNLRKMAEAVATHCARIGDGYDRGTGDVNAGDHIRTEFDL